MDYIGPTANGAILDVLLAFTGRQIERDHDLLSADIANVAGFVLQRVQSMGRCGSFLIRGELSTQTANEHFYWEK